ncbi:hypothetical protein P7C73_g3246, partial [Tremellales sp. Uapishka_1]
MSGLSQCDESQQTAALLAAVGMDSLSNLLKVTVIGCVVQAFITGAALQLLYQYFLQAKRDSTLARVGICWIAFFTVWEVVLWNVVATRMVTYFDRFTSVYMIDNWLVSWSILILVLVISPTLYFFTYRAYIIWDRNRWVLAVCLLLTTANFACGIAASATGINTPRSFAPVSNAEFAASLPAMGKMYAMLIPIFRAGLMSQLGMSFDPAERSGRDRSSVAACVSDNPPARGVDRNWFTPPPERRSANRSCSQQDRLYLHAIHVCGRRHLSVLYGWVLSEREEHPHDLPVRRFVLLPPHRSLTPHGRVRISGQLSGPIFFHSLISALVSRAHVKRILHAEPVRQLDELKLSEGEIAEFSAMATAHAPQSLRFSVMRPLASASEGTAPGQSDDGCHANLTPSISRTSQFEERITEADIGRRPSAYDLHEVLSLGGPTTAQPKLINRPSLTDPPGSATVHWYLDIDYAVITLATAGKTYTTTIDDSSPSIIYNGASWGNQSSAIAQYYNETIHLSTEPGDTLSFEFKGSSLQLFGATNTDHGNYSISIDGAASTILNGKSNGLFTQTSLFTASNLTDSKHSVSIVNLGNGPTGASFDFDYAVFNSSVDPSSISSASSSTPPQSTSPGTSNGGSPSRTSRGTVGGGVVGGVVALAILAGLLIWCVRSRRRRERSVDRPDSPVMLDGNEVNPFRHGVTSRPPEDIIISEARSRTPPLDEPYELVERSRSPERAYENPFEPGPGAPRLSDQRTRPFEAAVPRRSGSFVHKEEALSPLLGSQSPGQLLPPDYAQATQPYARATQPYT